MIRVNARSKRIIKTSNNARKVEKHKTKMALREKSRYGQTNGRIAANTLLKVMGTDYVSNIAANTARLTGHDYAAKLIENAAFGAKAYYVFEGSYKAYNNYM